MARSSWQVGEDDEHDHARESRPCDKTGDPTGGPDDDAVHIRTSDRKELIQCIKRGQRPTWVPKPGLEALCAEVKAEQNSMTNKTPECHPSDTASESTGDGDILESRQSPSVKDPIGHPIARSWSALHTGDFREDLSLRAKSGAASSPAEEVLHPPLSPSPPPFLSTSPPYDHGAGTMPGPFNGSRRSRAPSLGSSLSSSFVMRIPTSPLVHSMNNPSLDFSPRDQQTPESATTTRRKTLPPNVFGALNMSSHDAHMPNFSRPLPQPHLRREFSSPSPSHQSRRSLTSFTYQTGRSPPSAGWARSRRSSLASDVSPRQRASMVGSFEESILRGRMSAAPSKPLDFVAQIGVMGKGHCPASLKCPAHVTVPFPAVFYSYPSASGSRSISDDSPSPYVGNIDLERNLKPVEPPVRKSRRSEASLDPEAFIAQMTSPENTAMGKALTKDTRQKRRTHTFTYAPPGGAYRVPQQGQLQIIIKNPNKTAVKLFLIPYDLEGMTPGTKTFVRQRSFSSGPILEAAVTDKASTSLRDPLMNKDILRYLIHLKFCSPSKGRFYLYDSIRVVFANRVPDGKEKLRNEIQLPEPRYTPYKPSNESGGRSRSVSESGSPNHTMGGRPHPFDDVDSFLGGERRSQHDEFLPPSSSPLPFHIATMSISDQNLNRATPKTDSDLRPSDIRGVLKDTDRSIPPVPGFLPSTSTRSSPVPWLHGSNSSSARSFSPVPVEAGDGLLSRQLRELNSGAGTLKNGSHETKTE